MTMAQMIKHYMLPTNTHSCYEALTPETVPGAYLLVTNYLRER